MMAMASTGVTGQSEPKPIPPSRVYPEEGGAGRMAKLWRNRVEFYPFFAIYYFWLNTALASLQVKNRPGIVSLGLATIPSLVLITIATIKTREEVLSSRFQDGMITFHPFKYAAKNSLEGRRYIRWAYGVVIAVVLVSTYLHHWQPQVLNVPSNRDVTAWKNPTFETSAVYQRATQEEREEILANGVPNSSLREQFSIDLIGIILSLFCFLHCRKTFGFWMASCFLLGSFIYTGLEESMWILIGRFFTTKGTYWFTKGFFWFFETPVMACIGWFYIAYSCVLVAGKVFPNMSLRGRALIGGLTAMGIDLWCDPVVTSPEIISWVWTSGDILNVFGIPHTNFIGWFLLIFIFALFWEGYLPRWEIRWGRNKAATVLLVSLFGTKLGILVGFIVWSIILSILFTIFLGGAVHIPPGW